MSDSKVLEKIFTERRIDMWWKDLIGQDLKTFGEFDDKKAEKTLPVSEVDASNIILEKFKGVFSYIEARKTWYLWDGIIHSPCDGGNVLEKAVTEFYYSYRKALEVIDEAIDKKAKEIEKSAPLEGSPAEAAQKYRKMMDKKFGRARKFEERLGTNAGILAISRRLQTNYTIGKDHYENDRRWFVFKNGVLDLQKFKRGETNDAVFPHDPLRNVTKYFDAEVNGTNLGYWDAFIKRSIPDDESRLFMQKVVGASFMGITKSRMIVNLFGPPSSGKSTFIGAIDKLGHEGVGYCAALDKNAITKSSDQVNYGQNDFRGRRFISISEPDHRHPIDDDFLKTYSGDESVNTRGMYVNFEPWTPQGILFIASNAPLRINTRDMAIVDRLHMIEFPNSFKPVPGEEQLEKIEDLLYEDRSRILEWILQGMEMYVRDAMHWNPPQKVIEYRGQVIASASVALRWLDDMLEEGYLKIDTHNKNYQVSLSVNDAYARYRIWKSFNGERSNLSKAFFEEDISKKYYKAIRYQDKKVFPFIIKTDKYYKEYELNQIETSTDPKTASFRF